MSYCRFGEDSEIYVFQSFDEWVCCGCPFGGTEDFKTLIELSLHLQKHIKAGHKVPQYAVDRVIAELQSGKSEVRTIFQANIPPEKLSPPEWN